MTDHPNLQALAEDLVNIAIICRFETTNIADILRRLETLIDEIRDEIETEEP